MYPFQVKPNELTTFKVAARVASKRLCALTHGRLPMRYPTYPPQVERRIEQYHDDVRYSTIALSISRLEIENIEGAFAEVGVYQGATSSFIHQQAPERDFYLFDTFKGFPGEENTNDHRFRDTSQGAVSQFLGHSPRLHFRKGFFPETAVGLENITFSFVMLDVDLYQPSLDVLSFFYPRLARGGYFFMHDFNSPESNYAIARSSKEFMADKPELLIELPDFSGSALFRKI